MSAHCVFKRPWVDSYCCCNKRGNLLDNTNLLCYSSGTPKLKVGLPWLKSRQDRVPSRSSRGEPASWPYPVSRSYHTPWVLPHPLFSAANPSLIISLVLCPWERFSDFKESWDHFVSTQLIQNDLPISDPDVNHTCKVPLPRRVTCSQVPGFQV